MDIAGYDDLRREQAEKRARGELMGIGVSFFTEGVGAGPRKHMDILGLSMNDGADLRVHPSGKAVVSLSARRPRARATRRRSRRSSPRSSASRPRTSRSATATPTSRRTASAPTAAAPRRCPAPRSRSSRARCATRRALIAAHDARDAARGPRVGEGPLVRQGRPGAGRADRGHRRARVQRRAAAGGHGGRPRRAGHLRPAEPHLPLRRLHRGRRHRPRDRRRSRSAASSRSTTAACGSTR